MADVTLKDATKQYADGVIGAEDVNLSIQDGEFLILVGPSGCGKTTTLEMIAGLQKPTGGQVLIDGEVMNEVPPQERDLAMVFQDYALYPHKTVRGNMMFGLKYSTDLTKEEQRQKVEEAAELLGISDLLDQKPDQLSGGQQQRVALGRAIVRDPEVSLLDEPLSNLDAKLRTQMRAELQRLQDQLDVTMIYVTHDQTEAMTMGDRIAILDGGELQQVATPLECYHRPANRFVAGFIGEPSMNFFDVTREDRVLRKGAFEYPVSRAIAEDIGDATDLVMGVRPEDIRLLDDASGPHDFETTVSVVEPMGDENTVHLSFADGHTRADGADGAQVVIAAEAGAEEQREMIATVEGMRRVESGDSVIAHIPEEAIHVFDARNGTALHNREFEDDTQLQEPLD